MDMIMSTTGKYHGSQSSLVVRCDSSQVLQAAVNKEMAISNFHIEFANKKDIFKPGDELSGKVVMDVWSPINIRYVEFVISGKGTVQIFKDTSTFLERPKHEVYLDKKIQLIGPSNGGYYVTLDPGRYVTAFSYTLPEHIPPSVRQFDLGNGFVFDISYSVAAHVCDTIKSRYVSSSRRHFVKIIKSTKRNFTLVPKIDWQTLPGAQEPITHTEQVLLFCSPVSSEPTSVLVNLDKGGYAVGDSVKLEIEVFTRSKKRVRDVTAELEQEMSFTSDMIRKSRRTIISAHDKRRGRKQSDHHNMVRSVFSIAIPKQLVPSYLPHCHMLGITYTMKVSIRFNRLGGKLLMRVPVIIAPKSSDSDKNSDKEVPVFNKPIMQFPYFSKSPAMANGNGHAPSLASSRQNGTHGSQRSLKADKNQMNGKIPGKQNAQVTTKYETSIPCLQRCCCCCLGCMGFGIYETV